MMKATRRRFFAQLSLALLSSFPAACATLQPRLQPPIVSLESLRIESAVEGRTRIALTLALDNPNELSITLDALDFSLAIADMPVASGALTAALTLPALGTSRAQLEVSTSFAALRSALDASLLRGSFDYELAGNAVIAGSRLPFSRRGQKTVADLLGGRG